MMVRRGFRAVIIGMLAAVVLSGVLAVLPASPSYGATPSPSWSLNSSPSLSTSASDSNGIASVSCVSTSFCVAAGVYVTTTRMFPMLLTWNGVTWSLQTTSLPAAPGSPVVYGFDSVSCVTTSYCVAAGYDMNAAGNLQNLVLTWNGSTWSLDSSASLSTSASQNNVLYSVSCTSQSFCVAAGAYVTAANGSQNFVLTWNGSTWSLDSSPSLSTSASQGNILRSVSCVSPSFCAAAGYYGNSASNFQNLVLTWNGVTWSLDSSPSLSTSASQYNQTTAVSCGSQSFCVATGFYYDGAVDQSLLLTWNGSTWSLDSSPLLSTSSSQYNNTATSVSCVSPSFCVVVGYFTNSAGNSQNFVFTWNGSTWSLDSSPSLSTSASQDNALTSVSCISTTFCIAAGGYMIGDNNQNLLLTYSTSAPVPVASGTGYRFVASDGGIFSFGNAAFYGSMGGKHLNAGIVGMAADPATGGYWFVASDGGIFSFNAPFYGSMGGRRLNAPIVGMASDPATGGYWFVASDGGIFSFHAPFYGSMGGRRLNAPIVGMASTPDGKGYWFVASDGGIFSFGDAKFYGSMGGKHLNAGIVGMAADLATGGYWFVASDGGIFSFHAPFYGSMGGRRLNKPIVGMAADPATGGYWFVASDGGIFSFHAPFYGSMGGRRLNAPIVGMAAS